MTDRFIFDADHIHSGLWQGSQPPTGSTVRDSGFDLLVLCAAEYQPPSDQFPGVVVWHAPNIDDPMVPPRREKLETAVKAANKVVRFLEQRRPVLVTCQAGINRSSLVTGLALHKFLGISGREACELIRSKRFALTNPKFKECLFRLPANVSHPASNPKDRAQFYL